MSITSERKQELIGEFAVVKNDTGSPEVQVAILSERINNLTDHLKLHKPIYKASAAYGHFGREPGDDGSFSWEKTDLVDQLKNL